MKRFIGVISFSVAIGMLLMMVTYNRLLGLILIALFIFIGYNCLCGN